MTTEAIPGAIFSHGTMDCRDPVKTQDFLQNFLGIQSVRKSKGTQYMWLGGKWIIVCLKVAEGAPIRQGEGYRFGLAVGSPAEVDSAHAAALAERAKWEIREIRDVSQDGETRGFVLQDLNGNWWEIYHRPGQLYDDVFDQAPAERPRKSA